ncbi:MAG: hypothetical protein IKK21_06540 [Clostridia bacterium]|nr:hypothetical protein [Clostridia bacterium]
MFRQMKIHVEQLGDGGVLLHADATAPHAALDALAGRRSACISIHRS